MRTALITGFEPFAGLAVNPSAELLPDLEGMRLGDAVLRTACLPVSAAAMPARVAALLADHDPAFVLSLGLSPASPVVKVETSAINVLDFRVADNDGATPVDEPIDPGGPYGRRSTADAAAVVAAITAEGVPAAVSHHAGTHLCNMTLYTVLGALEASGRDARCLFVHLPYLPEQVVELMRGDQRGTPLAASGQPSMARDLQRTAVLATARVLAG
ncbi:pyroglutamyl-peptidase I family protein [Marinivivus vitaminiproducens]|uniref:pyroglutamyl-peptidase I family protein n=1 Tax=Marinivivus vitaminiproducens TaxID=3035935 RepID=UPI00279A2210|nr:hypothetical protein P4R82_09110 [Geminicoccaceae bacterium SCSIO 64248]